MRCLALAEELANADHSIVFAVRKGTRETAPRLTSSGFEIFELTCGAEAEPQALKHLAPHGCKVLVVDHYGRDVHFERSCREWALSIVVFDDRTGREHDCDVLLNSGAADPGVYAGLVTAQTHVLTGPNSHSWGGLLLRAEKPRSPAGMAGPSGTSSSLSERPTRRTPHHLQSRPSTDGQIM